MQVRALFAELGERLQGGRRRYLVGDAFTAADLTFASLAALVLLPEQYGGRPGKWCKDWSWGPEWRGGRVFGDQYQGRRRYLVGLALASLAAVVLFYPSSMGQSQ